MPKTEFNGANTIAAQTNGVEGVRMTAEPIVVHWDKMVAQSPVQENVSNSAYNDNTSVFEPEEGPAHHGCE